MRFGAFTALQNVSMRVKAGSFHALLGENGAGKSTLVKCMMGYYRATEGQMMVDGREVAVSDPKDAHGLGLGMVYQHFTLVPALTAAENLVIAREDCPAVIDWAGEKQKLHAFLDTMPFRVPLDLPVERLAAGERQKLEILKQLYLGRRFLILDEPTSVLTPDEADEVLQVVRGLCRSGSISVLMITHKFREVTEFADEVSVLRKGELVGGGAVCDLGPDDLATWMVGAPLEKTTAFRRGQAGSIILEVEGLRTTDRTGHKNISIDNLAVRSGEVVGIAGVSGNGQTELVEALAGQRPVKAGQISVKGKAYRATRREAREHGIRFLPEEPLRNACAPDMSVTENLSFRTFDIDADQRSRFWLTFKTMRQQADRLVAEYGVKTASMIASISTLSGGNVQRAVLARELTGEVDLLIISNPCFGLDFSAVAEIRSRIRAACNAGTAILLLSEDLDEILELSDRVIVMSEGRLVSDVPVEAADRSEIGHLMAGHA